MLFHAFNGQRARIVEGGMVVGPRRALMDEIKRLVYSIYSELDTGVSVDIIRMYCIRVTT